MTDGERIRHETRLRAAVLAGDESAWREWYDGCFAGVERYVRWRCGGRADLADDVLQEAWMTAVRRVRDFDPTGGAFAAWVCGIAANAVRNALRSESRRTVRRAPLQEPPAVKFEPNERALRTAEALAELNPRFERALRAKYLDGWSVIEMAAAWGETPKAVESVLSRAREAFRDTYTRLEQAGG